MQNLAARCGVKPDSQVKWAAERGYCFEDARLTRVIRPDQQIDTAQTLQRHFFEATKPMNDYFI